MTPERILIIRTDRIGDVVLTLPMAAELKKQYPQAHITFAVRNYTAPIAKNCTYVDEVIVFPEDIQKVPAAKILPSISKYKFDTVFIVSPNYAVSLLMFLAKIPHRIGNGYRWFSFLYTNRIYDHRSKVKHHELEYNLRMLKSLGIDTVLSTASISYGLTIPKEASNTAAKLLKELKIPEKHQIIIVHPGSGGSAMDLPEEKFNELILSLEKENVGTILVTGNKNEEDLCAKVCENTRAINLAGKFSLTELMGIIGKSDIFVSNSTGTLHIAAALGKQVVGFYPKIKVCSAKRWGPYTEKSMIFEPAIDCKNCTRKKCEKLQCMNTIDIARVTKKIKEICSEKLNFGDNNGSI
jgi:heptosyltransferase III